MKCKCIGWIALALAILGALNWGLWGFFQFDLVAMLFKGNTTMASRVVYSIIGLAGLYSLKKLCCCSKKCPCNSSCCCKSKCPCDCPCCKDKNCCK